MSTLQYAICQVTFRKLETFGGHLAFCDRHFRVEKRQATERENIRCLFPIMSIANNQSSTWMTLNLFWPIGRIDQILDWRLINSDQSRYLRSENDREIRTKQWACCRRYLTPHPPPPLQRAALALKRAPDFPYSPFPSSACHAGYYSKSLSFALNHSLFSVFTIPREDDLDHPLLKILNMLTGF